MTGFAKKEVLTLKTYQTLDKNNEYFDFIYKCSKKEYGEEDTHMHHIIPQYVFNGGSLDDLAFMDSAENAIELSVADHIKAHELLYKVYGNPQDKGAFLLLGNYVQESRRIWRMLGAQASHKVQNIEKKTFWSDKFQKEMAARSMANPNALAIRSAGGKKGGRTRNLGIAIKPHERYMFSFKGIPVLCVENCSTGGDVLAELKQFEVITEQETKLGRVTDLLSGKRASLYGWSCVKMD